MFLFIFALRSPRPTNYDEVDVTYYVEIPPGSFGGFLGLASISSNGPFSSILGEFLTLVELPFHTGDFDKMFWLAIHSHNSFSVLH